MDEIEELVVRTAQRLGDILNDVVFVGGFAAWLLVTERIGRTWRSTNDVDVLVEIATPFEYQQLEAKLRKRGFAHDTREGAPICRFRHGDDLILDVMPTEESILRFSNRWYAAAIPGAIQVTLGEDTRIRLIDAVHFVATKLDAFASGERGDMASSKDIEDIVALADGRRALSEEFASAPTVVREFVRGELARLIDQEALLEHLEGHLDREGRLRLPAVRGILSALAGR